MKELLGKRITAIYVSDDQQLLKFVSPDCEIVYRAWGDCCSETWFADIVETSRILGVLDNPSRSLYVNKVSEIEIPEFVTKMANKDNRSRQDFDKVYGYSLAFGNHIGYDMGIVEIIFRNSSNGYYGGEVELLGNSEWQRNLYEEASWIQITEDWQA